MAVPEFYSGKLLYPAIGVLIALSCLFGIAIRPRLVLQGNAMVGKPAPALTLPVAANGAEGTSTVSLADLKGHAVLLDFWASWCAPCAMEAPVVDRISRRYEKQGLVVLGVNVSDTPEVVKAYTSQKGLSYRMLVDAANRSSALFGVTQPPSLILLDKEGKVLAFLTGVVDESALSEVVAAAL
jgi:cytochrome c biogenesis protein CcmG, thiol:disulfide interchange protein DsbE